MTFEILLAHFVSTVLQEDHVLQQGVVLYHRTNEILRPGDTLQASQREKRGEYWHSRAHEMMLEDLRQKEFPSKPSRLTSVFSHLVPRGRFMRFGKVYSVKPVGAVHVADSRIIDDLFNEDAPRLTWDQRAQKMREYWEGTRPTRQNVEALEVLSDSAVVVELVEEPGRVHVGDVVSFDVPLRVSLDGYDIDGVMKIIMEPHGSIPFDDAVAQLKRDYEDVVVDRKRTQWGKEHTISFTVPPRTPLRVAYISQRGPARPAYEYESHKGATKNITFTGVHDNMRIHVSYENGIKQLDDLIRAGKFTRHSRNS